MSLAQRTVPNADRGRRVNARWGMTESRNESRRRVLTAGAATTALWVAPSVVGFDRVAAASPSAPDPTVTGDGTFATLSSGESLRPGGTTYSSNTEFFVFTEACNTLASGQPTDSGMTLPTGQLVTSYLIHYSPATGSGPLAGSVTLPGTIVGWDFSDASLAATDAQWGVAGVNYGVGRRRMEIPPENVVNDTVTFSGNTVSLTMQAGATFVDQIRIYVID